MILKAQKTAAFVTCYTSFKLLKGVFSLVSLQETSSTDDEKKNICKEKTGTQGVEKEDSLDDHESISDDGNMKPCEERNGKKREKRCLEGEEKGAPLDESNLDDDHDDDSSAEEVLKLPGKTLPKIYDISDFAFNASVVLM